MTAIVHAEAWMDYNGCGSTRLSHEQNSHYRCHIGRLFTPIITIIGFLHYCPKPSLINWYHVTKMTQLEADDLVVLTITPPIHSLCKHNHSLTPHSTNNSIINKTPLNKTTCIINLHRPAMIHKLMATGLIRCMHISHSTQTQLLFFIPE